MSTLPRNYLTPMADEAPEGRMEPVAVPMSRTSALAAARRESRGYGRPRSRTEYQDPAQAMRARRADDRRDIEEARAEAYKAEQRRLQDQQRQEEAAARAAVAESKARAKESEAKYKSDQRARNNELEREYRRDKRPMYTDADGNIQSHWTDEEWSKEKERAQRNESLREQAWMEQRPVLKTPEGNYVARHTDEEWEKIKADKAAAETAKEQKAADRDLREERKMEITQVQRGMSNAKDAIALRTQEVELQAQEAAAQAAKRRKFIRDTTKELEDRLDLTEDRRARMQSALDQAQAELEDWQGKADTLASEVRSQKAGQAAFQRAQQPVAAAVQGAEDALPGLHAPQLAMGVEQPQVNPRTVAKPGQTPPAAAPSPEQSMPNANPQELRQRVLEGWRAAVEQNPDLDEMERAATLADLEARQDVEGYANQIRSLHTTAELPKLEAALTQQQQQLQTRFHAHEEKASALVAQIQPLAERVQSLLQENAERLQQPHAAGETVVLTGPSGKTLNVFKDLADELLRTQQTLTEKHAQLQPEMDVLTTEGKELENDQQLFNEGVETLNRRHAQQVAAEEQAQEEERARLKQERAASYEELNRLPVGSEGTKLGDRLRTIDETVEKHAGGDDAGLREWAEKKYDEIGKAAQAAQKQQAEAVEKVYGKMRRALDDMSVFVDKPELMQEDFDAYVDELHQKIGGDKNQAAAKLHDARARDWSAGDVEEPVRYLSDGTPMVNPDLWLNDRGFEQAVEDSDATAAQKKQLLAKRPELAQAAAEEQLKVLKNLGVYDRWEMQQPEGLSDVEKVQKFTAEHEGLLSSGAWNVRLHQALLGTAQGVYGLFQSGLGVASALGSEKALKLNERLAKDQQQMSRESAVLPTGQWVNMAPNMLINTVPSLLGVNLTGAATLAGMQTFGQMYGNAVAGYQKQGFSKPESLKKAWLPAAAAGLTTLLLTKAGGLKGVESALQSGRVTGDIKSWLKALGGGALKEGWLEEAPDQLVQGLIERHTSDPNKTWDQVVKETLEAGIGGTVMGGMFEAMSNGIGSEMHARPETTAEDKDWRETMAGDMADVISGPAPETAASARPAEQSAVAMQRAWDEDQWQRQSSGSATGLREQLAQAEAEAAGTDPRLRARAQGDERVEMPRRESGSGRTIDQMTVAEGQVAAWRGEGMPERVSQATKEKAQVLLKIAQGAQVQDLEQEELMQVGLRREADGKIVPGHLNGKGEWKKGPRPDGFTSVELAPNGQLIITDRQTQRLRKVGLDALADVIQPAAEMRRSATARQPDSETSPAMEVAPPAPAADSAAELPAAVAPAADMEPLPAPEPVAENVSAPTAPEERPQEYTPEFKQRASEIAVELVKRGVPKEQALSVAARTVEDTGIDPDGYAVQMAGDGFEASMKAQGWRRKPSNLSHYERADVDKKRDMRSVTKPEPSPTAADSRERAGMPALPSKPVELSGREDWRKARESALQTELKKLQSLPKEQARAKFQKITTADKILVDQVDSHFGRLFDGVVVGTAPAGYAAQPTAFDDKGRATKVALVIDPLNFFAHADLHEAGIIKALEEELLHRVDLMVSTPAEAMSLARAIHAARPGVFERVWQRYYKIDIENGEVPAHVPKTLTDEQAFQLYFEATRMIHQGVMTTEAVGDDKSLLRQMYRYVKAWIGQLKREVRKLPKSILEEWMARIDRAEILLKKIERQSIEAEKNALDEVEPPERAQPQKKKPANEDEEALAMAADAEIDTRPERKGALRNPGENAIRGMRAIPDPDTGKENVVVWINQYHGRITKPSKGWLARMAQEGKDRSKIGDWDDIQQAGIPSFYASLVFKNGNGSTLDQALQELHGLGYFPGVAAENVTGEMLASKIMDVIQRYQAKKQGGATNVQDEEQAHFERLEAQRVEFERSTAKGPIYVKPHEMQPGDVMMVKADDGKMHRVEVLRLDTEAVPAGEDFDPDANPAQFMGPDGPMQIRSVTLKDGTTFGVQTIDGQQGLYVDAFSVRQEGDFYAGLSNAVQNRTIDDADAVLRVMQHEGMDATTPFSQIVLAIQQNLRVPMKRAQKMLAQVMDTDANATVWTNEELKQALESPLGAAKKMPSYFPNYEEGSSYETGLGGYSLSKFEKEFESEGLKPVMAGGLGRIWVTPDEADWVSEHGFGSSHLNAHALHFYQAVKYNRPDELKRAQNHLKEEMVDELDESESEANRQVQRLTQEAEKFKAAGAAPLGAPKKQSGPGLFGDDEMNFLGDRNTLGLFEQKRPVPPVNRPSTFTLKATTPEELKAEAERQELREKLQQRAEKPLVGTMGDIGQMDMLGGGDLFAQPKKTTDTQNQDAPATTGSLEPDRPGDNASDTGRTRGLQPATAAARDNAGTVGQGREGGKNADLGGGSPAGGAAPAGGTAGAEPVQGKTSRVPGSPARSEQSEGSRGVDEPRAAVESGAELDLPPVAPERPAVDAVAAERRPSLKSRLDDQAKAQFDRGIWDGFKVADAGSIAKSLPMLLPQQQQDVLKAERRFFEQSPTETDPKKGVLFTNGTGTGKTFTGLGIIKRFEMMGKGRVLIVVPSQQKVDDWKNEGVRVMVKVNPIKDTNDVGEDVVATTYANLRENWRLQSEPWDLVVYDESHYLSSNAQGNEGANVRAHELATNKPGWNQMEKWTQAVLGPRPSRLEDEKAAQRYDNAAEQASKRIQYLSDIAPDTKAVFLSATPFAYHKNLKYADGFLYQAPAHTNSSAYNTPQGFDRYLVENFGYTMRTNRLNSPPPEVDVGLMEREWAERQFQQGSMSGRMIDVPYDYSREFVLLNSETGRLLDEGFRSLSGYDPATRDRWPELNRAFNAYWRSSSSGYTKMMQFMESIKVADAIERMQQHLDLGRKIVLFHSYNNADPLHPFQLGYLAPSFRNDPAEQISERQVLEEQARDWMAAHPKLVQMNFKRLQNPRALVAKEFGGRVKFFNGEVGKKDRAAAITLFNDDNSGVDIFMVQTDAGKEGISLHDTTGKKQRVLMNASLPVKPTDAIQEEGRIYRIGVLSNAIQEYLVLHTNMERSAFGSKISQRTGTVENMALGQMARTLTDSFKSGYLNAHGEDPSQEQGIGGKEQDKAELLGDDFTRAKSYYFGRMKKTSRTKAAEGQDYFATPEPLGLVMVRMLGAKPGMDLLEPSAGHGAIGRWFPDTTANKFIEPSRTLADELRIKVASGKVEVQPFEDLHIMNKFDGVAMNPPFGTAGKLAIEHVAKASRHLRQGGRMVAIIPEGPAMQKRFDAWLEGEGADMHLRASYGLPTVTFERAGTSVKTRLVVLDKADLWHIKNKDGVFAAYDSFGDKRTAYSSSEKSVRDMAALNPEFIGWQKEANFQNRSPREIQAEDVKEFFDEIENLEAPARIVKTVATGAISAPAPAPMTSHVPSLAPAAPVATPAAASANPYESMQTLHAKKGVMTYVAKMARRLSDATYQSEKNRAKKFGGYYSAFKGNGAIPGFQFESAEKRNAFVGGYTEAAPLGAAKKRGGEVAEAEPDAGNSAHTTIDAAAHEAATSPKNYLDEPTEAQKEAGNYAKGHVRVGGHDISIENPAGSRRNPAWPVLRDHYGYLKGTVGADGDHVDVFVKPGTPEDYDGPVHVVTQNHVKTVDEEVPEAGRSARVPLGKRLENTGKFDELKVMLGYPTAAEAKEAYLRNFEKGWPGMAGMKTYTAEEFQKVKEGPEFQKSDSRTLAASRKQPLNLSRALQVTTPSKGLDALFGKTAPVQPAAQAPGGARGVQKFFTPSLSRGVLLRAYTAAMKGQSSGMVSLKRVFEEARAIQPSLTEEAFLKTVKEQDKDQRVMLEVYDTPEELKEAGKFTVRNASGVPAVRMMVLAAPKKQGQTGDMAAPEQAAQNNEPSPGGLNVVNLRSNWKTLQSLSDDAVIELKHATSEASGRAILKSGFNQSTKVWKSSDDGFVFLGDGNYGLGIYSAYASQKDKSPPAYVIVHVRKGDLLPDDGPDWKYAMRNARNRQSVKDTFGTASIAKPSAVTTFAEIGQMKAPLDRVKPVRLEDQDGNVLASFDPSRADGVTLGAGKKAAPEPERAGVPALPSETYQGAWEKSKAWLKKADQALLKAAGGDKAVMVARKLYEMGEQGLEPLAVTLPREVIRQTAKLYESAGTAGGLLRKPLEWLGSNEWDRQLYDRFTKPVVWDRVENGRQSVETWLKKPGALNQLGKGFADQVVPLWSVPREWLAAYHESQRKSAWGREKAMDVIRALSHQAKVSDLGYPAEFVENPEWRTRLFDAMEGKGKLEDLPPALQALAQKLRGMLHEAGREMVKQGILSLDTLDELSSQGWMPRYTEEEAEAAAGGWLKRLKLGVRELFPQRSTAWHIVDTTTKAADGQYTPVTREEGGRKNRWRFRDEQTRNAWYEGFVKKQALQMLTGDTRENAKAVTDMLTALPVGERSQVREDLRNLTLEKMDLPNSLKPEVARIVRRAVEKQRVRYKKEAPFEPEKLIKDPVYAVARYVMGATHNAAVAELFKVTAKNPEWVHDSAVAGYQKIPDDPRWGKLAGKYVRDDIGRQLAEVVDMTGPVTKLYDGLLRSWKSGKLVLNPGSHVRDAVGGVFFALMDGNNPLNPANVKYFRQAVSLLREGGPKYAELIEKQVLGGDAFSTQVKTALKGLLPDKATVEGYDGGAIVRLLSGIGSAWNGSYEFLSELRKLPDDIYKTAAYLHHLDSGRSAEEAAAEVRKWYPYYDRLSSSAYYKASGRVINPFTSFWREAVRIFGRAAMERPLALAAVWMMPRLITQLSLLMLGLGDDDRESVFRAMRGKMKALATETPIYSMLLPNRTDGGNLQQIDLSSVLPFADLPFIGSKRAEDKPGEDWWMRLFREAATASPVLATVLEQITNEDSFTGKTIVQPDMGTLETLKERTSAALGDWMPPLTPGVGVHAQTLANAGKRTSALDTRNKYQSWLRALVGLDIRSADPNLRKEVEHFRQTMKLPVDQGGQFATPERARLGRQIKGELIQDVPDVDKIADAMARLEETGNPIRTPKQMADLLDSLDPRKMIKKEFRAKLVQGFSPEAKRVLGEQTREFGKAVNRVPEVMSRAQLMAKLRREAAGR